MKTLLCATLLLMLSGCALLSGTQQALEAYEATKADVDAARADLERLTKELADIKVEYDAAVKAGDVSKAGALLQAGQQTLLRWEQAKAAFESSKTAMDNAIARVKASRDTESYLGNILGIVLGAFGGILGGFGTWGRRFGALAGAVKKTASNVDTFVPDGAWDAFTKAQRDALSTRERAVFDKAAGL